MFALHGEKVALGSSDCVFDCVFALVSGSEIDCLCAVGKRQ